MAGGREGQGARKGNGVRGHCLPSPPCFVQNLLIYFGFLSRWERLLANIRSVYSCTWILIYFTFVSFNLFYCHIQHFHHILFRICLCISAFCLDEKGCWRTFVLCTHVHEFLYISHLSHLIYFIVIFNIFTIFCSEFAYVFRLSVSMKKVAGKHPLCVLIYMNSYIFHICFI